MIPNLRKNKTYNSSYNVVRDIVFIIFKLTNTDVVTIAIEGVSGKTLVVYPGDGTSPDVIALNGGSTPWVHDYNGAAGTKTVKVFGAQHIVQFNSTGFALNFNMVNFQNMKSCTNLITTGSTITGNAGLFNKRNFPKVTNLIIRQSNLKFEPWQFATLAGTLSVLYNYINNGTGDLGGYASLDKLTLMRVSDNQYTYLTTTQWPAYNGNNIQIHNSLSTAAEVDRFLIDGNTALWTNCIIKADGTNPAPTAAAAVAIAELTGRGCTVTTN